MTDEAPPALQQEELMAMESGAMSDPTAMVAELASLESNSSMREMQTYEAEMAKMDKAETPAMPYEPQGAGSNPFAMESAASTSMAADDQATMSSVNAANYSAEQSAVSSEESQNAANEAAFQQSDNQFDQYISE